MVRPPGHHAVRDRAMGFCLFNNVAIGAAKARARGLSRVAIVDYDVHHGNGTQWSFYDDPSVLFVSSHRYPFYPGTGTRDEIGVGKGKGTTLNFPLPLPYGDDFFIALYQELVCRPLREFAPDMVFVSAGFDGHRLDPMGGFTIDTPTYGVLARLLVDTAEKNGGKILFVLEGGYHPQALKDSV